MTPGAKHVDRAFLPGPPENQSVFFSNAVLMPGLLFFFGIRNTQVAFLSDAMSEFAAG
jgi:hypothetical protein